MGILDYMRRQMQRHRSKHQTHVRKPKRINKRFLRARATVNPAGSKLAKKFAKAGQRGPRGY